MQIRSHGLILLDAINRTPRYLSARIAGSDYQKIIEILKEGWEEHVSSVPFEYEMLDRHYEGIYQNESQTRSLLYVFALMAIFISCLAVDLVCHEEMAGKLRLQNRNRG